MSEQNLVTTCLFHSQDFLVKMNVANCYLELSITDKQSGEEWQCSYDSAYIENLTRKTGNFKQFDIFTTMLKSGFLKTSECISLDLLTYEDLESLRIRRIKSHTSRTMLSKEKCNRRYLILIYNVEFDRILYPLPLEYCGPPDPSVLQATIRKLEMELTKIKTEKRPPSNESSLWILQKRIDELEMENSELKDEVRFFSRKGKGKNKVSMLQSAISHLEKSVMVERKSHHTLVEKLRREKVKLVREVEVLRNSERNLKLKLSQSNYKSPIRTKPPTNDLKFRRGDEFRNLYRNCSPTKTSTRRAKSEGCANRNTKSTVGKKSRDSSTSSCKFSDYDQRKSSMIRSRSTSLDSNSSRNGHASEILKLKVKNSEDEFRSLETRISTLQRMLRDNINIF